MTVESAVAVSAGLGSKSFALLAFGGDSFIELFSSLAVLQYLRLLLKETGEIPDNAGRRTEWVTAILLTSLIPIIGFGAAYSFLTGVAPEASLLGISVAVGAMLIMPLLWLEKNRIGKATNCLPLSIDAVESATCFYMATALTLGLLVNYLWKLSWIDYVATAMILIFVAREATESINQVRGAADS
jgi:divalent metal cation (Fe/Co/Zn/Cd) transporter